MPESAVRTESFNFSDMPGASECGRVCAVAGRAQREVREWAARYPGLFGAKPFDPALFNTVCLCTAFSAPWLDADELRLTNQVAVWTFGLDWRIDYVAASRDEVRNVVDRCLTTADGARPPDDDDLTRCLADLREELASSAAFPALGRLWQDELRRFLLAMAREWDWNAERERTGRLPTFDDYLGNTDNLGFSFAFVSHWIATDVEPAPSDVDEVKAAGWEAQRTMRLINDLGTYERDLSWGDLNGLMLGVTPEEMRRHVTIAGDRFRELVEPLRKGHPRLAHYMERQVDFCAGFQALADYWGAL